MGRIYIGYRLTVLLNFVKIAVYINLIIDALYEASLSPDEVSIYTSPRCQCSKNGCQPGSHVVPLIATSVELHAGVTTKNEML